MGVMPLLLDLFCSAGGATKGYQRAGFCVVGVDINPQPNYCGDEFVQSDALTFPLDGFDAIHASPPCQWGTAYARRPNHVKDSPNLIAATRERLAATGLPYVIEQPPHGGPEMRAPVCYCGSSFGLDVQRHRLFESNVMLLSPPCDHSWQMPRFKQATNRQNLRRTVEVGVWRIPLNVQRRAMGIDWMTLEELSEAIPPAYTEHIGHQLINHIAHRAA